MSLIGALIIVANTAISTPDESMIRSLVEGDGRSAITTISLAEIDARIARLRATEIGVRPAFVFQLFSQNRVPDLAVLNGYGFSTLERSELEGDEWRGLDSDGKYSLQVAQREWNSFISRHRVDRVEAFSSPAYDVTGREALLVHETFCGVLCGTKRLVLLRKDDEGRWVLVRSIVLSTS